MRYGIQGDVIYHEVGEIPSGLKVMLGNLVHKGESHHHTLEGDFKFYGDTEVEFIECLSDCKVKHEEHKENVLPKGLWRKFIALEQDHVTDEARRVID